MLGANIGSTLVVQLMSFNMEIAIPLLLLAGLWFSSYATIPALKAWAAP